MYNVRHRLAGVDACSVAVHRCSEDFTKALHSVTIIIVPVAHCANACCHCPYLHECIEQEVPVNWSRDGDKVVGLRDCHYMGPVIRVL